METFLIQSRRCCLRNTRWCAAQAAFFEREGGLVLGTRLNTRCGDVSNVRNVNVDRKMCCVFIRKSTLA